MVLLLAAALVVVLPQPATALSVTRAELRDGDLRVEGADAVPGAAILVDGDELGQADGDGDFRIDVSGFSSPECRITVDDGAESVEVDLDRCTPTEEPEAGAPDEPTWAAFRHHLMEGKPGRLRVRSATTDSNGLAFEFDLGDGRALRDPESGFHTPGAGGSVTSTELQPVWDTPGEFTVVATAQDIEGRTAAGEPRTVTIHPAHDDCGQQGDAADLISGDPPLLELPADCVGHLVGDPRIDQHDTYRFVAADRPLRLLTVQVEPRLPISLGAIWLELYRPDGSKVPEGAISGGTVSGNFAVTVSSPGEWGLRIGSSNLFDNVDYRLRVHSGGGGDDCVSGRGPTPEEMIPLDAPNNDFSIRILEHGEVDCVGFLPHADHDDRDLYSFEVERHEIVALNILDAADSDDHCRQGGVRVEMTREIEMVPRLACHVEFFQAEDAGLVDLHIRRGVEGRGRDVQYQIQLASSHPDRHDGDCFSGGDAGDSFATATPLDEAIACIGSLSGGDTEDWYAFPGEDGDQLFLQSIAGAPFDGKAPFFELYNPEGELHARRGDGASGFILDQTGQWRLRFMTEWPDGREPFDGAYGFWMFPRRGVPGRDCGTGADTPVAGLDVALPIDCEGSFLPYPGDTIDRYNFELDEGDTVEFTVAARSSRAQWTATLDTPSEPRAQSHWFRSHPRTFTHTATESGTYSLALHREPQTDSLDLAYSVAIRNLDDDDDGAEVELRPRVFSFAGNTTMVRGNTYCLETRVAVPSDSPPARDVTITLSESPGGAIRLVEAPCDSFSTDDARTRSVNIGGIPSPGETAFVWAIEARDEGEVDITLTAEDTSGAVATATRTFTIQK